MFWLSKKERLIKLVKEYKEWLYNKTSLYNPLINKNKWNTNLTVNENYINTLSDNEIDKWCNNIKKDVDWHKWI